MSPEAAARQKIDELLVAAGWALQDYKAFNPSAARGVAFREVPLSSGRCDFDCDGLSEVNGEPRKNRLLFCGRPE